MTIVEILIIHLSVGAPFGVLAFFGRDRASILRSLAMTSVAVLFWPVVLLVRFQRRLAVRPVVTNGVADGVEFDEILDPIRGLSKHEQMVVEDYLYLTVAGSEYEHGSSPGYEEFLRLAGNSQASIGAACLSRQRNRQIVERLNRSRSQLISYFTTETIGLQVTARVAEICERLNDHETAARMRSVYSQEPIAPSAIPGPAVISARPEPF